MKKLFIALALALFFFSCDSGDMGKKESGENGKEAEYYTVTYHKNTKYNLNTAIYTSYPLIDGNKEKDGDITGEPPVDDSLYKSGDIVRGEIRERPDRIFIGPGQGTMELEGCIFQGWVRRATDDIIAGMPNYTDENPQWFPEVPPRAGYTVYSHNVDFDPVWARIRSN